MKLKLPLAVQLKILRRKNEQLEMDLEVTRWSLGESTKDLQKADETIEQKQAEIDRLAKLLDAWNVETNHYKAEIERLRKTHPWEGGSYARICVDDLIIYAESIERWLAFCAEIEAEARAEFAERLKPMYKSLCVDEGDWCYELDNLVKEMEVKQDDR